jgi:lysophospholipid acyltransferase (LPLAT)-like uncharacterized protein
MKTRNILRHLKFYVLERVVLPFAIVILRILIWSWRKRGPDEGVLHEWAAAPRAIVAIFHGGFLNLLAYRHQARIHRRRFLVMITPSLDGRLLAAALRRLGIESLLVKAGDGGVSGSLEFVRQLEAGDIGVIAVDGPRGPAHVVKPEVLQLAQAARAEVFLAVTSAGYGIRFASWDHSHLPGPFSTVELRMERFRTDGLSGFEQSTASLQAAMARAAEKLLGATLVDELSLSETSVD